MLKKRINGYIYLVPSSILMIIFFIYPIALTLFYSFTDLTLTGSSAQQTRLIGLENYIKMFKDPVVFISIKNTVVFLIGCILGQQILGFLIAYLMKNKNKTFRRIVGPIILAGWVMPEIVCALCMTTFLGDSGTINVILGKIGIEPLEWLFRFPMLSVIIANIWHGTAFSMMVFQAALDDVPKEIEEAATVDGANKIQSLFKITIPFISQTIGTNTMLNTLQTLGVFGLIYTMTGGGPGTSTQTLPIFMYNQAFVNYQLGYGTAISMILLSLGIMLSVLYTRMMKRT